METEDAQDQMELLRLANIARNQAFIKVLISEVQVLNICHGPDQPQRKYRKIQPGQHLLQHILISLACLF